ncbi:hypothetical protein BJX64DRAFT_286774 [Aspergillus heterothallicus]
MAGFLTKPSQLLVPDSPEFDELEVRCTWSGEYEEMANLRISLEVNCVPKTQLQLLNVRDHDIYLENAFAVCLSQRECQADSQQEDDTPQSPLFGFSSLAVEGDIDPGRHPVVESSAASVQVSEARPVPKTNAESLERFERSQKDAKPHDEEPLIENPASPVQRPRLSSRVPESRPTTRSRKRSATDAELPDSYNDAQCDGALKEIMPRNSAQTSPLMSTATAEGAPRKTTAYPSSPRKSEAQIRSGLVTPNENACPRSPTNPSGAGGTLMSPGMSKLEERSPGKLSKIPMSKSSHESTPPRSSTSTTFIDTAILQSQSPTRGYEVATSTLVDRSNTEPVQSPNKMAFTVKNDPESLREEDLSPSPSRKLETVFEEPDSCTGDPEPHYTPRSSGNPGHCRDHSAAEEQMLSDQPEVRLVDGFIILINSERVRTAIYKVTVTVSIYIPFPNEKGWSDLMIPGLPRTGNGKSGFFLFLMPSHHGLELRTTNVKRAKLVENCFIAQFVNSGNLVVPMRRCHREYCGDVTDFTVDQEVIAHSIVKPTTSHQDEWEKFELRFNVMFAVRLHNRCFWTDRCSILIYVDGGPEGSYHCDISPRRCGLKKIHILANEYARTGVCCIHITCSPGDLEKLCLTWVSSGTGREAAYWVPRLYSASSASRERTRDSLRHSLIETLSKSTYLFSDARDRRVELTRQSEIPRDDGHADIAFGNVKDHPEDSLDDASSSSGEASTIGQILSRMERAVQLQLLDFARDTRYFLKWAFVGLFCLIFLGTKAFRSAGPTHYCPGRASLEADVRLEAPEEPIQISPLDTPGNLEYSVDEAKGISTAGLDVLKILNRYETGGVDEANKYSQRSMRDRLDYWLGWTGPTE